MKLFQKIFPANGSGHQKRYLSQAEILEDVGTNRVARMTLLLITFTVFASIAWAAIAELRETIKATGEVVPTRSVQLVQHLEGGIVEEVRVREGDLVIAGEVIARIAPANAKGEFESLKARRFGLLAKIARLRAFVAGTANPVFPEAPERYRYLITEQQAALTQQLKARDELHNVLTARLKQRQAEIEALKEKRTKLEKLTLLLQKRKSIEDGMLRRGMISRLDHLGTLQEFNEVTGNLQQTLAEIERAHASHREAVAAIAESDAAGRQKAVTEASDAAAQLAELDERSNQFQDRVQRLDVIAPMKGIVQSLEAVTVGSVIPPGGTIAHIVPVEDKLLVEARISPNDIGHVAIGDPASVKVLTYDFSTFGMIVGTLEHISATTFKEKDDTTYYKGRVALSKNHVGDDPDRNLVLPGMVTQVEIESGEKTVLEYLLHPVFQSLNTAMSER